ncbi:MAG TPA: hypothetical protein PK263_01880 [bacterium]|nr:hypothetical protein [bacterium]
MFTIWKILLVAIFLLLLILLVLNVLLGAGIPIEVFVLPLIAIIILLGLLILQGPAYPEKVKGIIYFDGKEEKKDPHHEDFGVVFSRGTLNTATEELPEKGEKKIHVNAVFGSAVVRVDNRKPIRVRGQSIFGSVRFPDGSLLMIGKREYQTKSYDPAKPHIFLNVNAIFGSAEITEGA